MRISLRLLYINHHQTSPTKLAKRSDSSFWRNRSTAEEQTSTKHRNNEWSRKMAIVSQKVSDLSGKQGNDSQFAAVVVRQHPDIDQPKALDVLVPELKSFVDISDNLVILEVTMPDNSKRDVYVALEVFNEAAPDMSKVLKEARGTRGRIPGTRVGNGG
ncbi:MULTISPECIES: hypothetical protein [Streptomyces]|uniref:Uncharacterized protein n=1 Tax=Streptomyces bobili TaxID=67280 RepID=A0ABZ1R801_9ACTN|nr:MULTISPECIES: hypothetical protein [Streptomyces]